MKIIPFASSDFSYFESFAADRSARLTDFSKEISGIVEKSMDHWTKGGDWYEDIVTGAAVLWLETFEKTAPDGDPSVAVETFRTELRTSLAKTAEPSQPPTEGEVDRVTNWVGVFSVNNAQYFAGIQAGHLEKTWITMEDSHVRAIHRAAAGQTVPIRSPFTVGGTKIQYPGEPDGPPEIWINCRCLIAGSAPGRENMEINERNLTFSTTVPATVQINGVTYTGVLPTFATAPAPVVDDHNTEEEGDGIHDSADDELTDDQIATEPLVDSDTETPWHGVLVVEGVPTGDKRQFDTDSLTWADLPLPLKFQRSDAPEHGGSVVIGRIDTIERVGNQLQATGAFNLNVPEAHEAIDGVTFGMMGGVSIDADSPETELEFEPGQEDQDPLALLFGGGTAPLTHFTAGRIRGATMVALPAFSDAYVALGLEFPDATSDAGAGEADPGEDDASTYNDEVLEEFELTSDQAAAFTALFDAFKEGDLSLLASAYDSFKDYNAADRKKAASSGNAMPDGSFPINNVDDLKNAIQAIGRAKDPAAAKAHIKKRAAALGQSALVPDDWATEEVEALVAAIGTHDGPGWLTHPRDTQRLRTYWTRGKGRAKIAWGVPGDFNRCRMHLGKYINPAFLAGTCANLHKEALGIWPGMEDGGRKHHHLETERAEAFALVASAATAMAVELFEDPKLDGPTALTIDGSHIFGHLALFGTCHIGSGPAQGKCITPPHSNMNYAMFRTGLVQTTEGPLPVGHITMGTGHANSYAKATVAAEHYDNTGSVVADIVVGEDAHGVWFSGALRPDLTDDDLIAFQSATLSGDWRDVQRHGIPDELVAALAVNVPGFPVPRIKFATDGDYQLSLVASGIVPVELRDEVPALVATGLTANDLLALGRTVADELEYRQERKERLSSARDPELVEAAESRRAARIAAAKEGV